MRIKELLKGFTINPPNVVITLFINKRWIKIERWEENDFSDLIDTHGNSDYFDWSMENVDGDIYVFFLVKKVS